MAGLAVALADRGLCVHYVAEQMLTSDRVSLGWSMPALGNVELHALTNAGVAETFTEWAGASSTHLCQGLRGNGHIDAAQRALAKRNLQPWIVMETVDDQGIFGIAKRLEYARLFRVWRGRLAAVLAIGHRTPEWVVSRGMLADRVFPFAYFLTGREVIVGEPRRHGPYRFLFVGQLNANKRIDRLIAALARLSAEPFELHLVGAGPLERELRAMAERLIPDRVHWWGRLPMLEVPDVMRDADCLVLPSRHEGWGAVVSEALIAGTPVICSDACGSAGVVRASGEGGVFPAGDESALTEALRRMLQVGSPSALRRRRLAEWARCLDTNSGASYLLRILDHREGRSERPQAPWESGDLPCVA